MRDTLDTFHRLAHLILDLEEEQPVANYTPAEQMHDVLDLSLPEEGLAADLYEQTLIDLIKATPKTSSKHFFNQLFGGRHEASILGELVSIMLNNSMYTYKVAGPMVGVEQGLIAEISRIVNYPDTASGTFAAGGSSTNLMAMMMARDRSDPEARYKGVQPGLVMYTSAESHYSIEKNAAFIGIGRDQIRKIAVDEVGRMRVDDFERQVKRDVAAGLTPCMVNSTAGTTVLGAFDPIRELAPICHEHNIWLHVDGAYCGGVFLSEDYRHLIDGVELTDSFSVNAHKMMNTSLVCSIIVTRDKRHLLDTFDQEASYLYQTSDDQYNLGKLSIQCGRRNDALKVWTLWRAVGRKGLAKMVAQQFALADHARAYVREHPDYTLHSFDDSISICFSYKDIPPDQLCRDLYEHEQLMVSHGSFQGQRFIRLVTINASNTTADLDNFFHVLEAFAERYYGK